MFTPGPWNYANRGDFCMVIGTRAEDPEPDGRTIAEILNSDTEAEDDARLIAAAPELLAALKGARLFVYGQIAVAEKQGWSTDHIRQEIAEYEAAIAKATLPR